MCYDVHTKLESQLKRAKRTNNTEWIEELERTLLPYLPRNYYHVSGFMHPKLLIYTNQSPHQPILSDWGLIPSWVKNRTKKNKIRKHTINARSESIYEKPAFKKAASSQHCIIPVDGFFEHYHKKGKTYPYYIYPIDQQAIHLAGLWDQWIDPNNDETIYSFSILTTKANRLLSGIHNNPKLDEARMPVILNDENSEKWLNCKSETEAKSLLLPFPDELLNAHTVKPIRGKKASKNTLEAIKKHTYEALRENLKLF